MPRNPHTWSVTVVVNGKKITVKEPPLFDVADFRDALREGRTFATVPGTTKRVRCADVTSYDIDSSS